MGNHNTHLSPGYTLNDIFPSPVNVAIFLGLVGPGAFNSLYQMSFQQWNRFSPCGPRTSWTPLCSCGLALPTRAPPGIELWSCKLCSPLVYIILTEFKPFPFSFFSSVPAAVSNFPLSLQLLLGRGAFPIFSPASHLCPFSTCKRGSLPFMASRSPSSALRTVYLLNSVVRLCRLC